MRAALVLEGVTTGTLGLLPLLEALEDGVYAGTVVEVLVLNWM